MLQVAGYRLQFVACGLRLVTFTMVEIAPFKAIRYKYNKTDLAKVLAPPYDVISPEEQKEYYRRHPENVIRLILGKGIREDRGREEKYQKAARFLNLWCQEKILKEDLKPAIYFFKEEYKIGRERKTREGFIALLRLKSFVTGGVFPHERTLRAPKEDRLRLLEVTRANFSPLFGLYDGEKDTPLELLKAGAKLNLPLAYYRDEEGVERKLWAVTSPQLIKEVVREMEGRKIFIADGHHRYEVNLLFAKKNPAHKFVLVYFTNIHNPGLTILPIHRVVQLRGERVEDLGKKISRFFRLKKIAGKNKLFRLMKNLPTGGVGMFANGKYYLLQLIHPLKKRTLDVEIVDNLILKKILKVDNAQVSYMRDTYSKDGLVFFLNPTKVEDVVRFCLARKAMPPKSTYFYPKLPSGLVIYRNHEDTEKPFLG